MGRKLEKESPCSKYSEEKKEQSYEFSAKKSTSDYENYHDEQFMDKLIEKIQQKKRGTNLLESPYNNSSIGEQTPSESSA